MAKDLKYFMRSRDVETVTAPGPENMLDDAGNRLELEIKILDQATIQRIDESYRKREIALDKQGSPYISANEIVFKTDKDNARAVRHIIAEALVYPDLKNKELMAYYDCHDISEMPRLVFKHNAEYRHVSRVVLSALGLTVGGTDDETIEAAKN